MINNEKIKIGDQVNYCRPDLNDFTASKGKLLSIEGENAFIEGVDVPVPVDVLSPLPKEDVIDIQPLKKPYKLADVFDKDYLNDLGFKLIKFDGQCGIAKSKKAGGKCVISFNLEGISCDYFGNKVEENVAVGISEDWGTRTVFNGMIRTREQLQMIVELTR